MRSVDPVRAAEIEQAETLARIGQQESEVLARQHDQRRQFETKFNQLVNAVADFGQQYNQGKGAVWPRREADRLRKAIREIQQVETSLRDDPGKKPAQKERASKATPSY